MSSRRKGKPVRRLDLNTPELQETSESALGDVDFSNYTSQDTLEEPCGK